MLIDLLFRILNHIHEAIEIFQAEGVPGHKTTVAIAFATSECAAIDDTGLPLDFSRVSKDRNNAATISNDDGWFVSLVPDRSR